MEPDFLELMEYARQHLKYQHIHDMIKYSGATDYSMSNAHKEKLVKFLDLLDSYIYKEEYSWLIPNYHTHPREILSQRLLSIGGILAMKESQNYLAVAAQLSAGIYAEIYKDYRTVTNWRINNESEL